jgi:hypothetical protein
MGNGFKQFVLALEVPMMISAIVECIPCNEKNQMYHNYTGEYGWLWREAVRFPHISDRFMTWYAYCNYTIYFYMKKCRDGESSPLVCAPINGGLGKES